MTLIVEDRVYETTTSTGTGDIALAGAIAGFRRFGDVMSIGDVCAYAIEAVDSHGLPTGAWETGLGTYSAANTLTRTTVSRSSNSNAAVSFAAGDKRVAMSQIAARRGPFELIDSQTVSGAASIVYDNTKITGAYRAFHLKFFNASGSAVATVLLAQVSPDNGVTWRGSNYLSGYENWGVSTNFSQYVYGSVTNGLLLVSELTNIAAYPKSGETTFYGLVSATQKKMSQTRCIGAASDNNIYDQKAGGIYGIAEAINALRVVPASGTLSGTFELYGVI